jgi:Ca2+-binding RTX toxin-like protein
MPKPAPSSPGPITIKGTRFDDRIVIGEPGYPDSPSRGFIIDGGNGNDFLAGGLGVDQIRGGAGFDEIVASEEDLLGAPAGKAAYDGGLDRDVLNFSTWTEGVGIDLGTTNISSDLDRYYTDFSMVSPTSLDPTVSYTSELRGVTVSIEGVIGGSANDQIGGDWGANYIDGGAGDDFITGKYGNDRLIGGLGNDLIMTGTDNDIVSGDIPGNPANHGNDIFAVGGGTVGAYYITTITDYDTRTDVADTQFDRVWINQSYDWYFDAASDGTLILVYGPDYAGMLGQIAFTGLTLADAGSVVVEGLDPMTGGPVLI